LQADINNYVTESKKGNNITTAAVPVTAPELVPGGLGSDATAVSANLLRVAARANLPRRNEQVEPAAAPQVNLARL